MKLLSKTVSLLFFIAFIYFAIVQYNDPDAFLWIAIYAVAALLSLMGFFGRYNKPVLGVVMLVSLVGAIALFPYGHFEGVALKDGMKTIEIELARESLGLGILTFSMLVLLFFSIKK